MNFKALFLFLALNLLAASLWAAELPACKAKNTLLDFNNEQVIAWRDQGNRKITYRAFIKGTIVAMTENDHGHVHFEVDLDKDLSTTHDRIEVVYNIEFGDMPDYRPGDELIACGDFVVDSYSPQGGVVHWLHLNPKNNGHENGYLVIDGNLTGLTISR